MASKPERRKNQAHQTKKRVPRQSVTGQSAWLLQFALAVGAGLLTYVLLPRLQFAGVMASSGVALYAICVSMLVFALSSPRGRRFSTYLKPVLPAAFLVILVANMVLQFKWMENTLVLEVLSTWIVIPVGMLWALFLSQVQIKTQEQNTSQGFLHTFRKPQYLIGIIILALASAFLLFYRLGYYDFWEDENLVINAAIGLRDQGLDYLDTGYKRAWAHSWIIAQSIQLFGESEWSARLPSALSGMVFVFLSCFIFFRWFRLPWVAILVPLICLLTDELLILFRYARMYAPLIPFFLAALFLTHHFLISPLEKRTGEKAGFRLFGFNGWLAVSSLALLVAAIHLHVLASVGFLIAFILLVLLAITTRLKEYIYFTSIFTGVAVVVILLGVAEVPLFKYIPAAIRRMTRPDAPEYMYYQFLFNNGLPQNVTLMTMVGGVGLFFNKSVENPRKVLIGLLYIIILLALIFMVYLMSDTGRDYRYIAHIVPFVVVLQLIVLFYSGAGQINRKWSYLFLALPLLYTGITFSREYKEVYVRHPWSPLYSIAYADIQQQYKPGEAILYQNMKTYYLDPRTLAGENAIKLGSRREMTLDQFKAIFKGQQSGWIVFDTHKSYHIDQEIQKYILRHCEKRHGTGVDATGVEVFYFNHTE